MQGVDVIGLGCLWATLPFAGRYCVTWRKPWTTTLRPSGGRVEHERQVGGAVACARGSGRALGWGWGLLSGGLSCGGGRRGRGRHRCTGCRRWSFSGLSRCQDPPGGAGGHCLGEPAVGGGGGEKKKNKKKIKKKKKKKNKKKKKKNKKKKKKKKKKKIKKK